MRKVILILESEVKTTFFNGVRHPNIGMFDKQGHFKLLHEFTYEQYKEKL